MKSLAEYFFLKDFNNQNTQNLLKYSEDYNRTVWGNLLGIKSVTTSNINIPAGVEFAKTITGTASIYQDSEFFPKEESVNQYTFSFYLHQNSIAAFITPSISFIDESDNKQTISVVFNTQNGKPTGTIINENDLDFYASENIGNGWYRYYISATSKIKKRIKVRTEILYNSPTPLASPWPNTILLWGCQLEKGKPSTIYIKTQSTEKNSITQYNFINEKYLEPSFGLPVSSINSGTHKLSTYYFPLNAKTSKYNESRRFTGDDSLTLSKNNLAYNITDPKYNLDVNGTFRSLSAYIETLSTNKLAGSALFFEGFDFIDFNMKINDRRFIFNSLTANKVFVTSLSSNSSVYVYIPETQDRVNEIFSSITWEVTAGGKLSAYNIFIKDKSITPFVSSHTSKFYNLSATDFTINYDLSSNFIFTEKINSFVDIDEKSSLYYKDKSLSTRLSSVYYFGIKPSDSFSTDNIGIVRSLSGNWNGSNGSIIETLPVLKPYFKNIKQVFDYVEKYGLFGEELNILIYEDILQNNFNTDSTTSESGCTVMGNLKARYYDVNALPVFMRNANFKSGDYIWADNNNADVLGKAYYWHVDRLNFNNLNMLGMYEIGSLKNVGGVLEYSFEKPFNVSPRKITFRAYVSNNKLLNVGNFGGDVSAWTTLYTKPSANTFFRPIHFNGDEMDINIKNLCFEFDSNTNDATCLFFKTGESYLSNVTVAALGSANYAYGAILAWPKSSVYIRGTEQIDPHLLSPIRWEQWSSVPGAKSQTYYPGYGLAIVGNPTNENKPTLFSNSFIQAWKSKVFVMDYDVNRRIGKDCHLNSSIILNGFFTSKSFFGLKDQAKIQTNNYLFKTTTFRLSNYQANVYDSSPNSLGQYINVFQNFNRDNFYYMYFDENNSTFEPKYFNILKWSFDDSLEPITLNINNGNNFTAHFTAPEQNPKYVFEPDTRTVNVTEFVFGLYQKNSLQSSLLNSASELFDYIDPDQLALFNMNGLYSLNSPIDPAFSYNLSFY